MGRKTQILVGFCLAAAGGGLLVHGIALPSIALIIAGIAVVLDTQKTVQDRPTDSRNLTAGSR